MRIFIIINAVLEIIAGLIFLFMPSQIPGAETLDVAGLAFVRMYGAGALALGFYAYQSLQKIGDSAWINGFLKTFATFHLGVALASVIGYSGGADASLSVAVLHGSLGLATLYFLFKK